MQTVIADQVIRGLEETAINVRLRPVIRRIARQWLELLCGEYSREVIVSVLEECHARVNTYVEMLYAQWCAATNAHVTSKSFEQWTSEQMIGKVTSGDFIAIPHEDKFMLIMPCKVAAEQTFHAGGYRFKLMSSLDGQSMVIAEMHPDLISL